jgi:ABC-2 type transport system ATP-binding protein
VWAIQLAEVSKRFRRVIALDGLSFGVSRGQCVALVGPNGAGKTTTFRILAGQIRKFNGTALIRGSDVRRRRERIGLLIDGPAFHPHLTVGQNLNYLALECGLPREQADQVSDSLLLKEVLHRRAGALSHGMKQRLGLAIASLTSGGEILLLDEPLTGLDPDVQHHVKAMLRRQVSEGAALLISSHNLPEVEFLADYYVFLQGGRSLAQGAQDEFAKSHLVLVRVRETEKAARILAAHQFMTRLVDGETLIIEGSQLDTEEMARALAEEGVHPREITVQRPSLEEIYLQLMAKVSAVDADPD